MEKTGIGLYADNGGHQIYRYLHSNPRAYIAASAGIAPSVYDDEQRADCRFYGSLEELVADERVKIVSLCSPVRALQADEAIYCMEHGKHVYAEKPCALTEEALDRIIAASERTGMVFREQAGTAFQKPASDLRAIVRSGALGEIVQVFAQKSYPYHDRRPQDEDVDGGLTLQNGVHAARFVEHVTGLEIRDVEAFETRLGNPREGGLRMAVSIAFTLSNGGVGAIIANYLNRHNFPTWGNEQLRVFGTKGFAEFTEGGLKSRMVTDEGDISPVPAAEGFREYFEYVLDAATGAGEMPLSLADELHPTRAVIRARQSAKGKTRD